MRASPWSALALLVALLWSLLPVYWFAKIAFLTPDEIARFPPPLWPQEPTLAAFFNIFGFDYTLADGTLRCSAPQSSLDALLKRVSRHRVVDFECAEAELEETFLTYYEADDAA